MNSNEGRWSIRLISIPSFGRSMCGPSGALNVARIRWGKRIFQKAYPFRSRGPKMWGLRERDIVKLRRPVSPPVGGIMTRSPSIVRSMRRSG